MPMQILKANLRWCKASKKKCNFIALLLVIACVNIGLSQWTQTNGPYGKTNVLAIIPTDAQVFTSTKCGYFSKKEIDSAWSLDSSFSFTAYTQIGDSLFIGGSDLNLIDVSDPNHTLTMINPISFTMLTHSDSCLYGATPSGFFKSRDMGSTWESKNEGLPFDTFWSGYNPILLYKLFCLDVTTNYIFGGTKKGIYRNTGNLAGWSAVNTGLPIDTITLIKSYTDTLFIAIGNELYTSSDFGESWSLRFTAPSYISSFLKVNSQYYVGTIKNGVYYSPDRGESWEILDIGLNDLHITVLAFYDSILFCGTNSKGVFRYQKNHWEDNNNGLICSSVNSMTSLDNHIVASTSEEVFLSADPDNGWNVISPDSPHNSWASVKACENTLFLSVRYGWPLISPQSPYILYSSDFGNTWNSLIHPPPFSRDDPYRITCFQNGFFAREDELIYFTDNLGMTWKNTSISAEYCNNINGLEVFNGIPYVTACGSGELLKRNSNSHWVLSNTGLPTDLPPGSIVYCEGALFTYVEPRGMYVSLNNGYTWSLANNGSPEISYSIRGFTYKNSNLFIATEEGVFMTSDYGQHWISINDGLKNIDTRSILLANDTLFVGTNGNGIWKQALSTIIVKSKDIEGSFDHFTIFPNPFSTQTTLQTTKFLNNGTLKVYNSMGQEVAQLNNIVGQSISFNRGHLVSGLYVIRITENNKLIGVKKLIITE